LKVYDTKGLDISSFYLLDCYLALEYISGESKKVGEIDKSNFYKTFGVSIDEIKKNMKTSGITFSDDMNAIISETTFNLVDFATDDFNNFQPNMPEPEIKIQ
jgi:hypothetical protein